MKTNEKRDENYLFESEGTINLDEKNKCDVNRRNLVKSVTVDWLRRSRVKVFVPLCSLFNRQVCAQLETDRR